MIIGILVLRPSRGRGFINQADVYGKVLHRRQVGDVAGSSGKAFVAGLNLQILRHL